VTNAPLRLAGLLALLVAGAAAARTIGRQRRLIGQLAREARADLLTGLPNRRGLAAHWRAAGGEQALILIDLVGFKAVNDSHGHIVGDALLQQVAARLAAVVASPGLLARWGGDEFVALVPAAELEAQLRAVAALDGAPYDLSARGGPAGVLVGTRIGVAAGGTDLDEALGRAARNLMDARAVA
jgi:cyclic di-GMP phosphodiesterase Gmr